MKRLGLLMVCFATLALASCGALQSVSSSNTVAQASGQACGTAVQGLYNAYKRSGTVDLTNTNNLNNALALASAYTTLKQNMDNASYRNSFTNGLILSSAGLITQDNATQFIDRLLATSGFGNINTQNLAQKAATAASIISLLNTLKQ